MSCAYAVITALRSQYVPIGYHVQHSTSLLGDMRKRRSKPKSKFVYRHYTQLLAVCPLQMAKANTRSSLANKQTTHKRSRYTQSNDFNDDHYVPIGYHVQHSTSLLGGMRKRRSNPKSKFVYRHYTQLLAVCPWRKLIRGLH